MQITEFIAEARGVGRKDYSAMVEASSEPTIRSYQRGFYHHDTAVVPGNYSIGQATFTTGSTAVVGVGTAWIAAMAGRRIKDTEGSPENWYTVDSVAGPANLTLTEPWTIPGVPPGWVFTLDYMIGGVIIDVAIPIGNVVILYDFYASRPNNKLLRMIVESAGYVSVDESGYQKANVHLSNGRLFDETIRFIIFNYDTEEETYVKFGCDGLYTTEEEYYMTISEA